jgi:hypothetical protein
VLAATNGPRTPLLEPDALGARCRRRTDYQQHLTQNASSVAKARNARSQRRCHARSARAHSRVLVVPETHAEANRALGTRVRCTVFPVLAFCRDRRDSSSSGSSRSCLLVAPMRLHTTAPAQWPASRDVRQDTRRDSLAKVRFATCFAQRAAGT